MGRVTENWEWRTTGRGGGDLWGVREPRAACDATRALVTETAQLANPTARKQHLPWHRAPSQHRAGWARSRCERLRSKRQAPRPCTSHSCANQWALDIPGQGNGCCIPVQINRFCIPAKVNEFCIRGQVVGSCIPVKILSLPLCVAVRLRPNTVENTENQ